MVDLDAWEQPPQTFPVRDEDSRGDQLWCAILLGLKLMPTQERTPTRTRTRNNTHKSGSGPSSKPSHSFPDIQSSRRARQAANGSIAGLPALLCFHVRLVALSLQ